MILSIQQYQSELQRIQQQGVFGGGDGVGGEAGVPGYNSNYARLVGRNEDLVKEVEILREQHHDMGCRLEESCVKVRNYEGIGEAGELITQGIAQMEGYDPRSGRAVRRLVSNVQERGLEEDDDDLVGSDSNIPGPVEYTDDHQGQLHHQEYDVTHKTPMQTTQKKHTGLGTTETKDDS